MRLYLVNLYIIQSSVAAKYARWSPSHRTLCLQCITHSVFLIRSSSGCGLMRCFHNPCLSTITSNWNLFILECLFTEDGAVFPSVSRKDGNAPHNLEVRIKVQVTLHKLTIVRCKCLKRKILFHLKSSLQNGPWRSVISVGIRFSKHSKKYFKCSRYQAIRGIFF